MDFVQEVQVKSSSFEAEFGGALGGVINVVPQARLQRLARFAVDATCAATRFNANNGDRGLRTNPSLPSLQHHHASRMRTPEYYMANKDQRTIVEPGYTVGGPLWKNKLWIFSSYIPSHRYHPPRHQFHRRQSRTAHSDPDHAPTHNAYNRLDYGVTNSLRLFGSWNYGYFRAPPARWAARTAPPASSTPGRTTDPNTLRADAGSVNPLAIYTFGGDWTPTAKLVVSARYGYFFNNTEQRGTPDRHPLRLSATRVNATTLGPGGQRAFPARSFNTIGFRQHPEQPGHGVRRLQAQELQCGRFVLRRHFGGTHTFKGGYFWPGAVQRSAAATSTAARSTSTGARAIRRSPAPRPATPSRRRTCRSTASSVCQGKYGYFIVGTGVINTGADHQTAQGALLPGSAGRSDTAPDPEPGRPLRQRNPAALRSHPLPDRQIRLGRQDRSPHRRRL